jgi:hypothetical protein
MGDRGVCAKGVVWVVREAVARPRELHKGLCIASNPWATYLQVPFLLHASVRLRWHALKRLGERKHRRAGVAETRVCASPVRDGREGRAHQKKIQK